MTEEIVTAFAQAESEAEVASLLNKSFDEARIGWRPIGDMEGNYAIAESQAAAPMDALCEIISNSFDAIFRRHYRDEYGDEYDPDTGIRTYKDAAETFLSDDGNDFVEVIADGTKSNPNIAVLDSGEGKPRSEFEDTFVGMITPGQAKRGWPFLQGQFGMGSSGVLPHSGERGHKLILTAGMEDPGKWTWTITRKNKEGNTYDYLVIDGSPPSFEGEFNGQTIGSYVKMFDYRLKRVAQITSTFRNWLDRSFVNPPLPITLREQRPAYESSVNKISTHGILDKIDSERHLIEKPFTIRPDYGEFLGRRETRVIVFKRDQVVEEEYGASELKNKKQRQFTSRKKQRERAVFLNVNGQVHGDFGSSFIKNRCDKYHIGRDAMVFIDFSDLKPQDMPHLFRPSRDRLADKSEAREFRDVLEKTLTEDDTLQEIEQKRRQENVQKETEKKVSDILQSVVSRNPRLRRYLSSGEKANAPGSNQPEEVEYSAPIVPDRFEIVKKITKSGERVLHNENDGRFQKRMPTNKEGWIRFELNAQNDYFDREDMGGELRFTPGDVIQHWKFIDGLLSVKLRPLPNVEVGDQLTVTGVVTRPGDADLEQRFRLEFVNPVDEEPTNTPSSSTSTADLLDLPEAVPVERDQWDEHEPPFDEQSIVRIADYGNGAEDMTIYYNIEAAPLLEFINRHNLRPAGKEFVTEVWESGVTLYTLCSYLELQEEYSGNGADPSELAPVSIRGVAQTMLDQHISEEEIEPWKAG